uniref:Uncharacterized protein n=1 Tax=Tanacetum cinerariifolium TaxID=118510 RepID=A0A699KKG7_TANCI|nr:hypothetical protein [Tanacetum cinerariifolium]
MPEKKETYKEKLLIKHGSDKSFHQLGDIDLWLDCSGEKVKGRTFEEKLEKQREDGVRHEIALRKEFEDQREDDRREWQAKIKEFQDIVLGKSPHSLPPN